MASAWVVTRPTKNGDESLPRSASRLGGAGRRPATAARSRRSARRCIRKQWVAGELAAHARSRSGPARERTDDADVQRGRETLAASRVDVAESTKRAAPHRAQSGASRASAPVASTRSPRRTSPTSSPRSTATAKRASRSARRSGARDGARPRRASTRTRLATGSRQAPARGARGARTRRPPSTSRPSTGCSRRSIGSRCCSSTGRALGSRDRPDARRRLRRAASARSAPRSDDEDPEGALDRAAPDARRGARGDAAPARIATLTRACSPTRGADALRTAIAKACRALGDPAVLAARPPPSADLAPAPARGARGRGSASRSASATSR